MKPRLFGTGKGGLTRVAVIAIATLCFVVFQTSDADAATARQISVSVDATLKYFLKNVKGAKDYLKAAKGVLVFPNVYTAKDVIKLSLERLEINLRMRSSG